MEWTPMEINPEMLNKLLAKLGVAGSCHFVDVLELQGEPLSSLPSPCYALMLLFPLTPKLEAFRKAQASKVAQSSEVYFLKQKEGNSCGTISLLHAVANNKSKVTFDGESTLKKFLDETADMTADDRTKHLEQNKAIREAHNEVAALGQCIPEPDNITFHVIALVNVNQQLYEFDGKMDGPVKCTATKDDTFLTDAANLCREFVKEDKDEVRFTAVALCHT